jgi:AcrR family transcriptional regulator
VASANLRRPGFIVVVAPGPLWLVLNGRRMRNGRCRASTATRTVKTGPVLNAGEARNDEDQCQEGHDDQEHLYPPWHAGGSAGRARGVVEGFRGAGVSHVRVLLGRLRMEPLNHSLSRHAVSIKSERHQSVIAYTSSVPKLWTETIEAHRHEVREAILDTAAALATEHGLLSVTMSQIAEETGIGRATLYKYFPDVEAILLAWHERRITGHLQHLSDVRARAGDAGERLQAVLEAYALIDHEHHGVEHHRRHRQDPALAALLHRGGHVARAHDKLRAMIRDLITEAAKAGEIRDDVAPSELATYCLHALSASSTLPSKTAVLRLVAVTLTGLRHTT